MKKIIHIDMDCFYAAIEMRDNPRLKNIPLAIGGESDRRGVICTCNYVARKYGVRAAMPTIKAYQLCPDLLVLPPLFEKYKQASNEIREIFLRHTNSIEPLSLDEAFLDVTGSKECSGSAMWLAEKIRHEILSEIGLTASAGIAPNKFLAKIASDWNKPNGQYLITPAAIDGFVKNLPVGKIFGVGKVMLAKLNARGIKTCGDLQAYDISLLTNLFGSLGKRLYELSRGIDLREVESNKERKSVSVEHTYPQDLPHLDLCLDKLPILIDSLLQRSQNKIANGIKGVFVKIKFFDFTLTTVDTGFDKMALCNNNELLQCYINLLTQAYHRQKKPVRLIGIGIRLKAPSQAQMTLEI